jgi:hypothetical protein
VKGWFRRCSKLSLARSQGSGRWTGQGQREEYRNVSNAQRVHLLDEACSFWPKACSCRHVRTHPA